MRSSFYLRYKILGILLTSLLSIKTISAQQSLINVNGWNAYVHVPWDYTLNPSKTYPAIIFFPGLDGIGSNASLSIVNGPGAYIKQGWNGNVKVGSDSVKFIVISLQPLSAFPKETTINSAIQALKAKYRIDNSRLNLTGMSMGGWCSTTFVTGDPAAGPYTLAKQIATVVEVEGMKPGDNAPYPALFDNFAKSNGRLLSFEQIYDGRDSRTRVNRMNSTKPGSGIFVSTNFGTGNHCCWEQFYGGKGVAPGRFILDGISQNIYEWIARNRLPSANKPPLAKAGTDKIIKLPVTTTTLSGSGTDADGSITGYAWTKISGPAAGTISSPKAASTNVSGLVQGVYNFLLTVTDNASASGKDTIKITVNPASSTSVLADAEIDGSIILPTKAYLLNGTGIKVTGSLNSNDREKITGGFAGSSNTGISNTTSDHLSGIGPEVELSVTGNTGDTAKDKAQIQAAQSNRGPVEPGSLIYYESGNLNAVSNLLAGKNHIGIDHLAVFNNRVTFNVTSARQQKLNINIIDVKGSSFLSKLIYLHAGINNFNEWVPKLTRGILYIKFFTTSEMLVRPVFNMN